MSDVALLKRLKKSKPWLHALCCELFHERGVQVSGSGGFQVRVFDATDVKEPGKTGSLWRIHYCVQLPSLSCDFFKLTETEGPGTGESFKHFPIKKGDHIFADRGYSTSSGIYYVCSRGAFVTVRVNSNALPIYDEKQKRFDLLKSVQEISEPGHSRSWTVLINSEEQFVEGRLCVIRKSEEAIRIAQKKLQRLASKKGTALKDDTLEYAKYVILYTTFPEEAFPAHAILQWYRIRWQVELIFKRFKSIAQLGHLPKHDDESAQSWLYGKLLTALLTEKNHRICNLYFPLGISLGRK